MAGTWHALAQQPDFNASTMLLLTDGRILCQDAGTANWHLLKPDAGGNYVNGSWSNAAPMQHTRLYYASAVLKDGRVFVSGGEYSDGAQNDTNTGEIYDPRTDTWSIIPAPPGWNAVGDAPCAVLPDGRVLVGQINGNKTAIFDPVANSWSAAATKGDRSSEETWVLLSDNTVVTAQCSAHPGAEKYLIASNQWVSAGTLPVDLVESSSIEIGAGLTLPDGRAFFVGATPHTALYTKPANPNQAGTWAAGPAIPQINGQPCGAKDAPGCLLPNGNVLFTVGPVDGVSGDYLSPTYFYEFDGTQLLSVPAPGNSGGVPYAGRMLLLPTGQVLYAAGTHQLFAYTPSGAPQNSWRPTITQAPATLWAGFTFSLFGTQLNGLSQACGYGDDAACATNYPLARLHDTATGKRYYCRTANHSTMAIATGAAQESTSVLVPASVPSGHYALSVIANGIASLEQAVDVHHLKFPFPEWEAVWQWLIGSLADGPLWAIGPHGPVPVDPMKEELAARLRKDMLANIHAMQDIAQHSIQQRLEASQKMPRSYDLEAGEAAKTVVTVRKVKPSKKPR